MPRLDQSQMMNGNVGHFGFSGVRPDKLTASEYTLVTIATDITGSVAGFSQELLDCVKAALEACQKSPRVNNLLVRYVQFNETVHEIHGFIPLNQIDISTYKKPVCNGLTALYDACFSSIGAANTYGKNLFQTDFSVNSIVFVITDGSDNASSMKIPDVKTKMKEGVSGEYLESQTAVLIGINTGSYAALLKTFAADAGFTQFIDAGNVTKDSLAKLAAFVSKSISSASSSLGTGGPSQPLTF